MKLALISDGNDFAIYDDAAWRTDGTRSRKLAALTRNMADFSILPVGGGGISGLPLGSYQTLNDALIALREAGFEFERYEK